MIKKYALELEGQRDFYDSYLKLIDSVLTVEDVLSDHTDGALNGNLLEFKTNINDLNSVLFQTIKYLSAFRIKGKPVPANIILISLNDGKAFCYHSDEYLAYIEQVYVGGASKDNMQEIFQRQEKLESAIGDKQIEISGEKRKYEELGENQALTEYNELNSVLKQSVSRFMRDFDIVREYNPDDMEEAFAIIADEWKKLESDYARTQAENKMKIPMYRGICKYLSQEQILEEDRQAYTRALFDNVNVFGITCTSRDRFTKSQLEELGRYGIEDVNIRTQGIDVVIIDEVSKSSFLDLLIPILYGKTVILVGDHRQLPPMYDLRHMRTEDFEGLDESIITKEINDRYTALYEECFFKTLYEKVPDDFRVMLNKQYRCHSHIMEVFNHFYGGSQKGLTIGTKQQDDNKQHNLTVRISNNTIIDPEHHIYFVDCEERESSAYEGSTSKVNEQEAQVAVELLRRLDSASSELIKSGKCKVNPEKRIDERPSVGVICTYGDQASRIKRMRKGKQFANFSGKQDEKLIISTVDDFQGDERDIIILSMVRNPAPGKKFDLEFLKKFERINVALSRARKLLIVVGAWKFLSDYGIIDLPDMEGNHSLDKTNYPVYREIKVSDLQQIVLNDIRKVCAHVREYENEFVEDYRKCTARESASLLSVARSEIKKAEYRLFEIERIIVKLYEEKVCGTMPEERFNLLAQNYETEQAELKHKVETLKTNLSSTEESEKNVLKFIAIVKSYTEVTELTPEILNSFIDKIFIGAPHRENKKRLQEVRIVYKLIGAVNIPQ